MPTLTYNREQYAAAWVKQHGGFERKAYKVFKAALDEQVKPVIDYTRSFGLPTDTIIDMLVKKPPMEAAYKSIYISIGTAQANYTLKSINRLGRSVKAVSFFSDAWRRLMESFYTVFAAERVTEVTDTTREKIRRLLDEANAQNLSVEATATYLVDELSSPDFNRNRALVIARTESTTAANKGASLGAADADYETVKEWMAVTDRNTRRTHLAADGQTVEIGEDFTVGGELAQFPGDTRLSAKEVIQCRCSVAYIPKLDVDGLPVLK